MSKYDNLWYYIKNCGRGEITLTFAEIGAISGTPINHSFLRYKKELAECGWEVVKISMKEQKVTFENAKQDFSLIYSRQRRHSGRSRALQASVFAL